MKNLFKKLLVFCAIICATSATVSLTTTPDTSAASRDFLGLTTWDDGTNFFDASGNPKKLSEEKIKKGIWVVVVNIINDLAVIAAFLTIGFVIYGGYQYIFSAGDPGKVASGKKTLTRAFIGLAIVMSARVIMGAIRIALVGGTGDIGSCVSEGGCLSDTEDMIFNLIDWTTGVAGIIAVIFVVYGGLAYTTSAGDPNKVEKAKKSILYALIGLAIVGLSMTATAFARSIIKKANNAAFINETTISKEVYEIQKS